MAEAGVGHYVYCVMPEQAQPPLTDVAGVDPRHPVEVLRHAGLAAVTGLVALDEFGSEPLKRNLNDLEWLARTAGIHQEVLDRAFASGPIVPLRLCTIYSSKDHIRRMLEREHDALVHALADLRDRSEWGVKLIADARHQVDPSRESEEASGRAYLERRSRERRAREQARALIEEAAAEVHQLLGEQAVAGTLLRPQTRELHGREGEMVFNGAYLVEASRVDGFRAVAEQLRTRQRQRGLALEVTGPWPPYNFVEPPER